MPVVHIYQQNVIEVCNIIVPDKGRIGRKHRLLSPDAAEKSLRCFRGGADRQPKRI